MTDIGSGNYPNVKSSMLCQLGMVESYAVISRAFFTASWVTEWMSLSTWGLLLSWKRQRMPLGMDGKLNAWKRSEWEMGLRSTCRDQVNGCKDGKIDKSTRKDGCMKWRWNGGEKWSLPFENGRCLTINGCCHLLWTVVATIATAVKGINRFKWHNDRLQNGNLLRLSF